VKKIKNKVKTKQVSEKSIKERIALIDKNIAQNRTTLERLIQQKNTTEAVLNAQLGARSELMLLLEPKEKNDGAKDKA
jgi:hypothetical protein